MFIKAIRAKGLGKLICNAWCNIEDWRRWPSPIYTQTLARKNQSSDSNMELGISKFIFILAT